MKKVIPLILSGLAAVSFSVFAQTSTTSPKSDTDPAVRSKAGATAPEAGGGTNANVQQGSASTGASGDEPKPKKAKKAKVKKSKDAKASSGTSSDTSTTTTTEPRASRGAGGAELPKTTDRAQDKPAVPAQEKSPATSSQSGDK